MEAEPERVVVREQENSGDEEGQGDEVNMNSDSSEEEPEDEAEALRIRQGFIVDEDEEDDNDSDAERSRRRRKRRKHHHRKVNRSEDEDGDDAMQLDEDDLELLAETGGRAETKRRLYKRQDASGSSRRNVVESSDEDLDDTVPRVQDIQDIWNDTRDRSDDDEMMDDFIEEDEEEDPDMDQETRDAHKREKRLQKIQLRKATREAPPALEGLDASAWLEIHDVFGDGHEYDWAIGDDDDMLPEDDPSSKEMRYQDVFEPSQIAARFLTEDDDLIRAKDVPERLQLTTSTISKSATLSDLPPLTEEDLGGAALWIIPRMSSTTHERFFAEGADLAHLQTSLVTSVTAVLSYMFIEQFEVPYIWAHKRDYLAHFDVTNIGIRPELLSCDDLWRIFTLGQKYKALLERRRALSQLFERLNVSDEYYVDEISRELDSVEIVADASEWLAMKYKAKRKLDTEFTFHDDEDEDLNSKRQKMPSRISAYEVAKRGIVARLADGFGIHPYQIAQNFLANQRLHFVDDQELNPLVYAEGFVDPDPTKAQDPTELLRKARLILATELGRDPLLRNAIRKAFKDEGVISVEPTERGVGKILETHPYFSFKYLQRKPISKMLQGPQFLNILAAEAEHLVSVSISLPPATKDEIEHRLAEAFTSDNFSDSARGWNQERAKVVREVLDQFLIPVGIKWAREYIRQETEDFLANQAGQALRDRIDVTPYKSETMDPGDIPTVLAISWGMGDPLKDAITLAFVDKDGHLREQMKIDNLSDEKLRDEFIDLVTRKVPDVIVVGGFSMATTKLAQRVRECLQDPSNDGWDDSTPSSKIPIIYAYDDVARLYQHSPRAVQEFSSLPTIAKYCVGLARYVQSPLIEFASLGADITAITLEKHSQHLIPQDKLLAAFERSLVDVTNAVGVDMNKAVGHVHYRALLPFISGLGPRKAEALVKKIEKMGGNLVNRDQFVEAGLLTTNIFLNAAAFLRIIPEENINSLKAREDQNIQPDALDESRIHPEDYDLARKMASDAMDMDEEDTHGQHPSFTVSQLKDAPDQEQRLNELNLDDFAISLHDAQNDQKRHTLNLIRDELLAPFADHRPPYPVLETWDILTMLSGETPETLHIGLIIPVLVVRVHAGGAIVRLDSGIEGTISKEYLADIPPNRSEDAVSKGQTVDGVVFNIKFPGIDSVTVELSKRQQDVMSGDGDFRKVHPESNYWDHGRHEKDTELLQRKKRADTERSRRVIKHPNFHNFNATQAENYLAKQQRGDLVIRPSSKGMNHLAITWKIDDGLYQHIDVTEPNADPTGQTIGSQLIVDAKHSYSDLDELIVNHVQAMARRLEELMIHERFKSGPEEELHVFLKNVLAANPAKSMYGFTLNRKKPGHFNICFLANKQSSVQTWPVRVAPEAYYLFEAAAPGVPELCDAFKVRHLHESQNASANVGRTPYGAGGRTPARPAYGTTPGHMSSRQPAPPTRTPNPYGGATPKPAGWGGAATPAPGASSYAAPAPPPQTYGYQTPRQPPAVPAGMNPQRAAMLQQGGESGGGGWGSGSGW